MENQELITIKQLPIIEEHLITIKNEIEKAVENALSLECNEDTYKQIKTVRADMNRDFNELETKRKDIKKNILAPYDAFEKIYKECVSDVYLPGKARLDERISDVENRLKGEKEAEAKEYFEELKTASCIDFINFGDVGINITMNASKKSIHEKIKTFVDKISEDLEMISTQEYASEILVEYKKTFNVSTSIIIVTNRKKAIEEEQARIQAAKNQKELEAAKELEINEAVNEQEPEFTAPAIQEVVEEEPKEKDAITTQKFKVTFSVETYDLDDIKAIVALMRERGVHYEQL